MGRLKPDFFVCVIYPQTSLSVITGDGLCTSLKKNTLPKDNPDHGELSPRTKWEGPHCFYQEPPRSSDGKSALRADAIVRKKLVKAHVERSYRSIGVACLVSSRLTTSPPREVRAKTPTCRVKPRYFVPHGGDLISLSVHCGCLIR